MQDTEYMINVNFRNNFCFKLPYSLDYFRIDLNKVEKLMCKTIQWVKDKKEGHKKSAWGTSYIEK